MSTLISCSESFRETGDPARFHREEITQTGLRQAHDALRVFKDESEPLALRQSAERFCEGLDLPDAVDVKGVL